MKIRFHHAHLFAQDLDASLRWWITNFDAVVRHDVVFAGARNVFMSVGDGRLHFYDQPPTGPRTGPVHHLGFQTDDLAALHSRLEANQVPLRKPITKELDADYLMVEGPDGVLLELFQPHPERTSSRLKAFFAWPDDVAPDRVGTVQP
jgi:catechol 2,3-dioxygenase-like lactoylglutathione lyase family enzyme